jgi:hypothetical protein
MTKQTPLAAREFSGMTDSPSANKSLPGYLLQVSAMGMCILRITNLPKPEFLTMDTVIFISYNVIHI